MVSMVNQPLLDADLTASLTISETRSQQRILRILDRQGSDFRFDANMLKSSVEFEDGASNKRGLI